MDRSLIRFDFFILSTLTWAFSFESSLAKAFNWPCRRAAWRRSILRQVQQQQVRAVWESWKEKKNVLRDRDDVGFALAGEKSCYRQTERHICLQSSERTSNTSPTLIRRLLDEQTLSPPQLILWTHFVIRTILMALGARPSKVFCHLDLSFDQLWSFFCVLVCVLFLTVSLHPKLITIIIILASSSSYYSVNWRNWHFIACIFFPFLSLSEFLSPKALSTVALILQVCQVTTVFLQLISDRLFSLPDIFSSRFYLLHVWSLH